MLEVGVGNSFSCLCFAKVRSVGKMLDSVFRRINVYVLGSSGCGKSTLINCLIKPVSASSSSTSTAEELITITPPSNASISSTSSSAASSSSTQDRVVIYRWKPSCPQERDAPAADDTKTRFDEDTTLQFWDLTGKESYQEAHFVYMASPCLILLLIPVNDDLSRLSATINLIQDKCPGSHVIVVLTLCDQVKGDGNKELTRKSEQVSTHVTDCLDARKARVTRHVTTIASKVITKMDGEAETNQEEAEINGITTDTYDNQSKACVDRVTPLGVTPIEIHDTIFNVSTVNDMGLQELRTAVLEKATSTQIFPHLTKKPPEVTKPMIDVIEEGKHAGDVLYQVEEFRHLVLKRCSQSRENEEQFRDACSSLQSSGHILVLPGFTGLSAWQEADERKEKKGTSAFDYEKEGFVCIDLEAFTNMLLDCVMEDNSKTFRIEASRFWPQESGFKTPDPDLLSRVLECLPGQGVIREAVFPLLWQSQDLTEVQILNAIRCLHALGVLVPLNWAVSDYAGLAMPNYPRLSPVFCHGSVLMNMLSKNRPQLNWTTVPYRGDIQVTWRIASVSPFPSTACNRCLALVKSIFQSCAYYIHLWDRGLLIKFTDASVCVEKNQDAVDISCRVNGDDPASLKLSVQVMWSHLMPIANVVRTFLATTVPGLVSRTMLLMYGTTFYVGNTNLRNQEFSLVECISQWQAGTQGNGPSDGLAALINLSLLFPFEAEDVWTTEDWIKLVLEKRDHVLGQTDPIPSSGNNLTLKRGKTRWKHTKRRKAVEVQWRNKIAEDLEGNDQNSLQDQQAITDTAKPDADVDKNSQANTIGSSEGNSSSRLMNVNGTEVPAFPLNAQSSISPQRWHAEATALANRFVASIMAVSVADYVTSRVNKGMGGSKIVGAAKATAARVTADAAVAVQNGDLEGAARAVLESVQSVTVTNTDHLGSLKPRHRSCFCVIL